TRFARDWSSDVCSRDLGRAGGRRERALSTATRAAAPGDMDARLRALHAVWSSPPGWRGRLTAVNHSTIGLRFIVTGLAFFLIGGGRKRAVEGEREEPGG